MKFHKHSENPILSPHPASDWESLVTTNPGAWYEDGTFYLLYRAAGDDAEHYIHFGLATSSDGVRFYRASDRPVFSPNPNGPDYGCVEDARIVRFGEDYFITYAYRPFPPGRYWENEGNEAGIFLNGFSYGEDAPAAVRKNLTASALAMTRDFHTFRRLGRITRPDLDDRDVILFPEKINGKYVMLHRPMQWVGEEYGTEHPAIWIAFSDDLLTWGESQMLLKGGTTPWEYKVGGSTPPLKTDDGWLVLYHGVGEDKLYRIGALLLDLDDPTHILARTSDYLMEPEHDYEFEGYYKGVVFPTGNVIVDNTLYVYYGGADKYCCLATAPVDELLAYLKEQPVPEATR